MVPVCPLKYAVIHVVMLRGKEVRLLPVGGASKLDCCLWGGKEVRLLPVGGGAS